MAYGSNDFVVFLMALIWEENWVNTWECFLQYGQCKLYSLFLVELDDCVRVRDCWFVMSFAPN